MFRKFSIDVNAENIERIRARKEELEAALKTCAIVFEKFILDTLKLNKVLIEDYEKGSETNFIEME